MDENDPEQLNLQKSLDGIADLDSFVSASLPNSLKVAGNVSINGSLIIREKFGLHI